MLAAKDYLDAIHKCEERIRTNWITFATLSYGLAFLILNRDHRCWIVNWSWQKIDPRLPGLFDPFEALKEGGLRTSELKLLDRPDGVLKEVALKAFPPDTLWLQDPKEIVLVAYVVFALFVGSLLGRAYSDRHEWLAAAARSEAGGDIPMRLLRTWRAQVGRSSLISWGLRASAFFVVYVTAVLGVTSLCKGRTGRWFEDMGLHLHPNATVAVACLIFGGAAWWWFRSDQATQRRATLAERQIERPEEPPQEKRP